jgi:uncharacterized membrane protein YeaQ/YmgE (transglycosylase-associated protein family)
MRPRASAAAEFPAMSVIEWLAVGLTEGFIAGQIAEDEGLGFIVDLVLGAAGALAGGLIYSSFELLPTGIDWISIIAATLGAVVVLAVYHTILSRFWF